MRKIVCKILIIISLFTYSLLLVSCKAITAQNIKIDSGFDKNNGLRIGGEFYFEPRVNGEIHGEPGINSEFHGSQGINDEFHGEEGANNGQGKKYIKKDEDNNLIDS